MSASRSLSVYVHFPWCLQKCPYCDFASGTIARPAVPHVAYADAVLRELEAWAPTLERAHLQSVFFGGGTPSLWAPVELGRVLRGIRTAVATVEDGVEVTVECNPSSLDQPRAAELAAVGVNRLSVGVQSLSEERLRFLGRLHDGPGALRALSAALAEVRRVSADMMFGMPGQGPEDFLQELDPLLDLGLSHLSVYALTVEPGTQFGALQRKGRLSLAPERDFAGTYLATEAKLDRLGFEHYEVSNYAQPGEASRHNQHYWRAGAYLGLGAGAVGCLRDLSSGGRRYRNDPRPAHYMEHSAGLAREASSERLQARETVQEGIMLGLRTMEGVDLQALGELAGVDPRVGRESDIARQAELGNLHLQEMRMWVPQSRWLHLDGIVSAIF